MLFEEFFKRKKIDLAALQAAEGALFSEFKTHYEQMGEKSFDHTKKYWFNKIRRQFHLAPEVKAEKALFENRVAEQTITESLTETTAPAPPPPAKLGFVPKFKAGNMSKPAVSADDKKDVPESQPLTETEQPTESGGTKSGYIPRF